MDPMPWGYRTSARRATLPTPLGLKLQYLDLLLIDLTPLVTINHVLTSDRAYVCPCFYQRLAFARLSAHSRYRAVESEAGVEAEAGASLAR